MSRADDPHLAALMLYREFCSSSVAVHAVAAAGSRADHAAERGVQAGLLRCVVGDPFSPVTLHPTWLTPTAVAVARHVYDARAFHDLPVLADALQDAGCDDAAVLDHCRGPGPHARGCWVVDLVLGEA